MMGVLRRGLPLLLFLAACGGPALSLAPPQRPPAARDYHMVYERWTRHGRVFNWREMDNMLLVAATLRSVEYQQALGARKAAMYGVAAPAERERLVSAEVQEAQDAVRFFLRTEGHEYKWGDLTPHKALWRIALLLPDGSELSPQAVGEVKNRALLEEALFIEKLLTTSDSLRPFSRLWHITFAPTRPDGQPLLQPGLKRLTLRLAGPQGKTDMTWKFK
jgi:hypothetical protein